MAWNKGVRIKFIKFISVTDSGPCLQDVWHIHLKSSSFSYSFINGFRIARGHQDSW